MKAYWFAPQGEKLRYGDNRPVCVGETHTIQGKVVPCSHGLHGSIRVLDALQYAQSSVLYVVDISGDIQHEEDKIAGNTRKYLQRIDVESILKEFARKQALINIEKIRLYTSAENYSLIVEWLTTGQESLRSVAWSAARSAARSAADSAAWSAAEGAAWSAAEGAAWSAAEGAAWSAAEGAAWSAAEGAAWSAAEGAAWSAAEGAAWSAADSAAWSAANTMLEEMIRSSTK